MKNLSFMGCSNYCITRDGKVYTLRRNRFMNPKTDKNGYKEVSLIRDNGDKLYCRVHRLVAFAFLPEPTSDFKDQINHINGIKDDNRVENLEWVTNSRNQLHSTHTLGNTSWNRKLSVEDAHLVCKHIAEGKRNVDIAKMFGVTSRDIGRIRNGESYLDVSKGYSFPPDKKLLLSTDKVIGICKLLEIGYSFTQISKKLKCCRTTVSNIYYRRKYKDLSSGYNW